MKRITKFLINGLILTGVSVLLQTADSAFTVYISGKIGADGIGLFGLVMSIYRFAITFAMSGLGLAATRTVSEYLAISRRKAAIKAGINCITVSLIIGVFASVMFFVLSGFLSCTVLHNPETEISLKALSFSLLPISLSSSLSGIFLAHGKPSFSAAGNIISFVARTVSTVLLLNKLNSGLKMSCFSLTCGITVSEWAGVIFLIIAYAVIMRNEKPEKESGIYKKLVMVSLPVALSSYIRSALYTVEQLLIPKNLRKFGESEQNALAKYGIIKGMVLPIILMPSSIVYSFSGLLVPELTKSLKTNNSAETKKITSSAFYFSFMYSIGVCAVLFFFAEKLSVQLYGSTAPGVYIRILAPLTVVMYLDGAVDNLLKGLGQQFFCMKINIADSALSLILVCILVPIMGINGYVSVILISEVFNTVFSAYKLIAITGCKIHIIEYIAVPVILATLSCAVSILLFPHGFYVAIITSVLMYAALTLIFHPKKIMP